jgi:hypothetical protein
MIVYLYVPHIYLLLIYHKTTFLFQHCQRFTYCNNVALEIYTSGVMPDNDNS